MELEISRRTFLVLAATAPLVASLPVALAAPPAPPEPAPVWEELPISGLAGECSGRF